MLLSFLFSATKLLLHGFNNAEDFGNLVHSAPAERIAPQYSPHRKYRSFYETVSFIRFKSVSRTGRIILTAFRKKRAYEFLIEKNKKSRNMFHSIYPFFRGFFAPEAVLFLKGLFISFKSRELINFSMSVDFLPSIAGLATNTISKPMGNLVSLSL